MWSWLGYMNPHRLTWGFAYDFPFAQLVAVATLAGTAWYAIREGGLGSVLHGAPAKLLLCLWAVFSLTTITALEPDAATEAWSQISKIMLMAFLTIYLIDTKEKLRFLVLIIALSIGFYGVKGGIFSILTGGENRVWGPPGSFIEDNNALALALNMVLPFLFYMAEMEKRLWIKAGLYFAFGTTVLAVLFTYSRGGFLGLAVVLTCITLTRRFRTKLVVATGVALLIPLIVGLMPEHWMDRMRSITEYQQDGSALSRLEAWTAAWNLATDRPLTGGGFNALNNLEVYYAYNPAILEKMQGEGAQGVHASGVHSIYFELLAENGFPGFVMFILLCVLVFAAQATLVRRGKRVNSPEALGYGRLLAISLLAYLICGAFQEMVSFDLFYQVVAITIVAVRVHVMPTPHLLNETIIEEYEDEHAVGNSVAG